MANRKKEVVDFEGLESHTTGDTRYWNGEEWVIRDPGTPGQILTTHGAGLPPTWETYVPPFTNTKSMQFDGIDDYVSTPVDLSGATKFTISGWFYKANEEDRIDISQTNASNTKRLKLLWYGSLVENRISVSLGDTSGTMFGGQYAVTDTGWKHLALVFDASLSPTAANMVKLYVNGSKVTYDSSSANAPLAVPTISETLNLGYDKGSGTGGTYGKGNLDEVAIWNNTALSASEVTELYNLGTPEDLTTHSQYASLSNWWRMGDEGIWNDISAPNEWIIPDQKGSDDGTSVNMEFADVVTDVP